MQSQINKTQILAKVKKCHKNISKLNEKLYIFETFNNKSNFNIEKNSDEIKSKAIKHSVVIINDETSVELIMNTEDPQQDQVLDIKQTARKLISRFYYHIKQKMKQGSINQIEALKQFCDKEGKNDLYLKLHQGFLKLYFEKDSTCKECHQVVKTQSNCLNHIRKEHLADLEIYICIKCKLSFSKGDVLEKHIQQQHYQQQNVVQSHKETKVNVQQMQSKQQSNGNCIQHRFNQKLDLNKIVQNIQPQPILKKILVPQQNNNSLRSSSDEAKKCMPVFNQVYIPVEFQAGNAEENHEDKQDLNSNTIKKPSKLKIKFIQVQKNDKTQIN
ncbi:unnamed protein product (macronuclear) [Paramecium tetraurelia]|uniref:C2H2-type domain-containing protein n=1 Tax=Paramecium tetraurelia TaxID=5888 RepID=A0DJ35_PARTE|nr:uncharacterized protein GSPATT00017409001 [Paramecium tetraurelia]CAK83052.1 unnamed protein product [Paramecium tetraurelia]|eukprot:XP_001450449.1 hypothetical protein (macronuclear) [Paramecium tetraurelia strain d4-2]